MMFLIIIIYLYWLDFANIAYFSINTFFNHLENLSNYLKDYLNSNNISVTNTEDGLIISVSADNKLLDTNFNNSYNTNITTSDESKPFYKSKSFWIVTRMYLVMAAIYV
jgi:hypothetical protein